MDKKDHEDTYTCPLKVFWVKLTGSKLFSVEPLIFNAKCLPKREKYRFTHDFGHVVKFRKSH